MNLPVAAPMLIAATSPFDIILHLFNTNPYFIGIMMLLLNVGGRFIGMEITKKQEQFLQHPWVRRVIIFTAIFIATRNLWVAFWTTLVVILLLGYLFNENSALCIFGNGGTVGAKCSNGPTNGPINGSINGQSQTEINNAVKMQDEMTQEEKEILQRLHAKSMRYAVSNQKAGLETETAAKKNGGDMEDSVMLADIYSANMSLLRR